MKGKRPDLGNSGQALIITSLIIAMLLLSTVYYVFEVKRSITKDQTTIDPTIKATKLSIINTIISALANFTNGGERGILTEDLTKLSSTIENHSYEIRRDLQFTPLNSSPYQAGMWISWGSDGLGISSACASYCVNSSGPSSSYYSECEANVTTTLVLEGTYTGNGTEKNVNVTCKTYNEKEPALANDITLFYQNQTGGPWMVVDSSNNLNMLDFGDGTYFMSFNVYAQSILYVSANLHDARDVFVMANATCTEV